MPGWSGLTPMADLAVPMAGTVVLDTHIVLDLWVFQDPAFHALGRALEGEAVRWLATAAMREELQRVLDYPQIAQRRQFHGVAADAVLAQMDRYAHWQAQAPRCVYVCKDPDDQKFIDLAAAHQALLLSKDMQVLRLRRRLQRLGAQIGTAWPFNDRSVATTPPVSVQNACCMDFAGGGRSKVQLR